MTSYDQQRWVFKKARQNGWDGWEPDVLGTPKAEQQFQDAKKFLLSLPQANYANAHMWFSGTCDECKVWNGQWNEYDTSYMECPECGHRQSVFRLKLNEQHKRKSPL